MGCGKQHEQDGPTSERRGLWAVGGRHMHGYAGKHGCTAHVRMGASCRWALRSETGGSGRMQHGEAGRRQGRPQQASSAVHHALGRTREEAGQGGAGCLVVCMRGGAAGAAGWVHAAHARASCAVVKKRCQAAVSLQIWARRVGCGWVGRLTLAALPAAKPQGL